MPRNPRRHREHGSAPASAYDPAPAPASEYLYEAESKVRVIEVKPILTEIGKKEQTRDTTGKKLFAESESIIYKLIINGYSQLESILYNTNDVGNVVITIKDAEQNLISIDSHVLKNPYYYVSTELLLNNIDKPIKIKLIGSPTVDMDGVSRDFCTNLGKELKFMFMFSGKSTPLITEICKLELKSTVLKALSKKNQRAKALHNECILKSSKLRASKPISEQPIDPNPQLINASSIPIAYDKTKSIDYTKYHASSIFKLAAILAKFTIYEEHKLGINFNMFILLILFGYTFTSSKTTLCELLKEHESHESNKDSYEKYNAELFTCCGRLMVLLDMYPIDGRITPFKHMIDSLDSDKSMSVFLIVIKILKEFLFIDTMIHLVESKVSKNIDQDQENQEKNEVQTVITYLESLFQLGEMYRKICTDKKTKIFEFELKKYSPFVYASLLSSELKITVDDILKKIYITKEHKRLDECEIEATLKDKNDALASSEDSEIKKLYDTNYIVRFLRSVDTKIEDEYDKQQILFKFLKHITGSIILPHIIYVNLLPARGPIVARTCFNLIDIYQPTGVEDTPKKFEEDYKFLMEVLNGNFNIGDSVDFDLAGGSKKKTRNTHKLKLKLKHKKTRNTHKRVNKNY
jgi:hypothetical protein